MAASVKSDDPMCVSGTEVQLNGLCQDGGVSGVSLRVLAVWLTPQSLSMDLFILLCKLKSSASA